MRALITTMTISLLTAAGIIYSIETAQCTDCLWDYACYSQSDCGACICVKADELDLSGRCAYGLVE